MSAGFGVRHEGQHEGGCLACQVERLRARNRELTEMLLAIGRGEMDIVHVEDRGDQVDFLLAPPGAFHVAPGEMIDLSTHSSTRRMRRTTRESQAGTSLAYCVDGTRCDDQE